MNTPAHVVVGLAVLSRRDGHRRSAAIVAGALIPDLAIILFYAWYLMQGIGEDQIWSVEYFKPAWQGFIDCFNSIPLIALALILCWKIRHGLVWALLASMLLHTLTDLPLHHDDAHRHFFPFFDWRFVSPVSYWDPAHHGNWFGLFEMVMVGLLSAYLYLRRIVPRIWVIGILLVYLIYWVYVFLVWV